MAYILNDPKVDRLQRIPGHKPDRVEVSVYDDQGRPVMLRMTDAALEVFKAALGGPIEPRPNASKLAMLKCQGVCGRIALIVNTAFAGNQTAAAKSWGTAQPIISRIMSGHRRPTLELLFSIAQTKDLNLTWLINGEGKPFKLSNCG